MSKLKTITRTVLSYCDIPEKVIDQTTFLEEAACDVYVEHRILTKKERKKYDDNFALDDWILTKHPDLEGRTILIHIDY